MSELVPRETGQAVASTGSVLPRVVRYGILIAQLGLAGLRLRGLSEQVRGTYKYVEDCSSSVDRLADQMAGLEVDVDTVAEHHGAAAVMRAVLEDAEAMASDTEELASLFDETAAAHEADYGAVAAAAQSMPVPMAQAEFYSNR
ncbi:hypothetical protein ABZW11_26750 [Nonomuraea sp. NPDC004580]|uniref:hypothetical protein n=1 Tax=Nonomuraea sp. NPDC004580 TaxID=3154552 RepID=UPI0033AC7E74